MRKQKMIMLQASVFTALLFATEHTLNVGLSGTIQGSAKAHPGVRHEGNRKLFMNRAEEQVATSLRRTLVLR